MAADVGRRSASKHLDFNPMVAGIGGRSVQPVAHIPHLPGSEGVRLSGSSLGIFAGARAVKNRVPGNVVAADLGLCVVIGAPVIVVMPYLDLIDRVCRPQV